MLSSSSSPFGQSSSSPFGSLSEFGQTCSASNNPFAPMPFGFGSQFGGTSTGVFGSLTRSGTSTEAQSTIFRSTAAFMDQQCGSSMVAEPYVTTRESDGGGKLVSISAMPAYKDKSHEELRWEASEKLLSISAMPAYEEKSHEQIRWEYYHQLGDKGASSVFRQTSSPSISNPSNFAPASTNTTSTFNLPPLISNPSSFDPASTSTTFKFNPTAPSAAPTVPDDGTSKPNGF